MLHTYPYRIKGKKAAEKQKLWRGRGEPDGHSNQKVRSAYTSSFIKGKIMKADLHKIGYDHHHVIFTVNTQLLI